MSYYDALMYFRECFSECFKDCYEMYQDIDLCAEDCFELCEAEEYETY